MEENKKQYLLNKFKGKIPVEDMCAFKHEIDSKSDSSFERLDALKLKSKTVTLLLSILLSGWICRLYLRDYGIAIAELVTVVFVNVLFRFLFGGLFSIVSDISSLIYWIAEIFLCYKRVKSLNGEKVLTRLRACPQK